MPLLQYTASNTMNKNPLNKGILTENAIGIGTVTPEMVEARARELAVIAGRVPPQPSQVDYEQAKRELTGEPEVDVREAALELIPESERWDPVPGSTGRHTPESFGEDEDSEGRSESAQLVEEGIEEAEHDQMLQAARAAQKRDQREHFTMQDGDTSERQ
jgi:hypothetical protein